MLWLTGIECTSERSVVFSTTMGLNVSVSKITIEESRLKATDLVLIPGGIFIGVYESRSERVVASTS